MSEVTSPPSGGAAGTGSKLRMWPVSGLGWVAFVAAVVGLASFPSLMLISTLFAATYPVFDSWVMPIIGLALVDIGAALSVVVLLWRREITIASIVAGAITMPVGLFVTFMVVGEWLGGA